MKKTIKLLLTTPLIAYLLVGIFLFIAQDNFIYFPTPKSKGTYKEKIFINENESIHVTVLNDGNEKAVIYFGGNAENVDYNADTFSDIFISHTIYLVKYRGYGNSTGEPSEKNFYSDSLFIYDTIKTQHPNISVIGRSIGSGVATFLASKREILKLVLITPFDSVLSVAQEKIPFYPMSLILSDKYDSIARVDSIDAQTLVLTAENDKIIGKKHSDKLVNKFPTSQVTIKVIKNENHNSISSDKNYYLYLKEFLH
ncbi:MAG: esterase/lipase [Sulfurimonas sp.]|jgi:esterase/lipase|uniref:alpha/beta hydrolase n=1 Tax=Sulfurimonas sp. TaxID=2022749 RepID=UPI0039E5053F